MKTCTKCRESKQVSEFHKKAHLRDGLNTKCKACACAEARQWRVENHDRAIAADRKRHAENRDIANAKRKQRYQKNWEMEQETKRKWAAANKEKVLQLSRKWAAENPEKKREICKRWISNNPEKRKATSANWSASNPEARRLARANRRARERLSGGTLSRGLAKKLFDLQRGKCACCGLPLGDDYHLDHIMPLALGGTNTDDNIQLLRKLCNLKKSAKHPVDFMQSMGFLL